MLGLAKPASDTEAPAAGDGAGGEARPKRGQGFAKKRRAAPGTEKPKKKKLNKKAKLRKLKAAMAPKGKAKSPQG